MTMKMTKKKMKKETLVIYGPLHSKKKIHLPLLVYDYFCIIFIDRPGSYYIRSTPFSSNRSISKEDIYTYLLTFANSLSTCFLTTEQTSAFFSYGPVKSFLNHFLPRKREQHSKYYSYFTAYLNFMLSPRVELSHMPCYKSKYDYGVKAKKKITKLEKLPEMKGLLTRIFADDMQRLKMVGADFSTLTIPVGDISLITPPELLDEKEKLRHKAAISGNHTKKIAARKSKRYNPIKKNEKTIVVVRKAVTNLNFILILSLVLSVLQIMLVQIMQQSTKDTGILQKLSLFINGRHLNCNKMLKRMKKSQLIMAV